MPFAADRLAAALAAIDPGWRGRRCLRRAVRRPRLQRPAARDGANSRARSRSGCGRCTSTTACKRVPAPGREACRESCAAAGIPLQVISLRLEAPRGASLEAAAREARYAALAGESRAGRAPADGASSRRPARDRADPAAARRGRRRTRGDARARAPRSGLAAAAAARRGSRGASRLRGRPRASPGAKTR